MAFTHLHLHTEYSLLDGACRINEVIKRAKELNQTSVAITDHGVMYGAVDFYKAAKAEGVKAIIGCECYVAPRSRLNKVHGLDSERYHLVLLCKNNKGYENLAKMVSIAWTEGFYTKPRIDRELIEKYHEGIVALSGCLAGEIPQALLRGDYEYAKKTALWYDNVFGHGNYFLEIQNHGLREQLDIIPDLIKLSEETDIPLVATNDAHYVKQDDAEVQQVLICIGTNHILGEDTGLEFKTQEFYLKSEDEMLSAFSACPDAVNNTQIVAEMCNVEFEFGNTKLPHFEVPNNMNHFEYFKNSCFFGLCQKFNDNPPQNYIDRLNYELEIINKMGYVDYFLIVHDFIRYAKSKGIPVGPGRGSGAGSLAAYCIGITGIDPIEYNLLFERFLNPERISMPDFDIDFCYVNRQRVIDYVTEKYGADHVAQIVTFGTLAARAAIRDVGRVMGISYQIVDSVAKQIPNEIHITIEKALSSSKDLRNLYEGNDDVKRLIDMAKRVEGMPRHASTHAAGVVITRDPVSSYVPLAVNDESVVTQYTMTTLEQLGLLKMDFLGLRTLTVIDDTVKMIRATKDSSFSLDKIDVKDKATFEMLSLGKTDGVFQFESAGMRSVLSRLKPQSLEDLIAVISLYRPGPADSIDVYIRNRHNPQQTEYKCELVKDILSVTYGCMVYQEQVMEICRKVAGYSYGRADLVRRAMSKKKLDVMEKERQNFIYGLKDENGNTLCCGAVANGVSEKTANELFDEMSNFAKYAFNKSHAAAYAYVSYQTAWLKCHYPHELMAATLTSILDQTSKVTRYITECNNINIPVLPPSVNESMEGFSVSGNAIRFGLLAIKNIGKGFISSIINSRQTSGKYKSFYDFCKRTYGKDFNRRAVESLIKCGALDGLGTNRRQMLYMLPSVIAQLDSDKSRNIVGQIGFFDEGSVFASANEPTPPEMEEMAYNELLAFEKEITGMYLSGHPMNEFSHVSKAIHSDNILSILESQDGFGKYKDICNVKLYGLISSITRKVTKSGATMCFVEIEDLTASIECIVFSSLYSEKALMLQEGNIIVLSGRLSFREDKAPNVIAEIIEPNPKKIISQNETEQETKTEKKKRSGIFIKVKNESDERLRKLKTLISIFEGNFPVYIYNSENEKYSFFGKTSLNKPLVDECKHIFSEKDVVVRE
ncbi:MAG: DNA polymerase III subunit alpha [Clostridia bacterium]|nr:DNA polymerase III subunit alpha [Clostridia bacterium]